VRRTEQSPFDGRPRGARALFAVRARRRCPGDCVCVCACAFASRPTSPSDRHSQPPVSIFKVSPAGSSTHSKAERAIIYACAAAAE